MIWHKRDLFLFVKYQLITEMWRMSAEQNAELF